MKIKVCFNNEIHRVSKLPDTYKAFLQLLSTIFHCELPKNWTLQYVDSDGDNILMNDDKDYEEFRSLDSQDKNSAIKVFVISVESFKGNVIPAEEKKEIVEKVENKIDDDFQIIENLEASVKVEEKPQKEKEKPVVEEVVPVPVPEVQVDKKEVVPEEQEVEEKKEVPQEVEKKEEEKVDFYPIQPKEEVLIPENKEVAPVEVKENKALVDVADIGKMIESLIQDKIPQVTETLKKQFDAQNISFAESVIIDPRDKILPDEVLKPLKPEIVHYGIKCNDCQVMPIVGIRYKCTVCPDFNLCSKCEDMQEHEHNLVKMRQRDLLDVFKPQVVPQVQICPKVSYPGLNENDFPKLESKPVVPKKEDKKGDAYFKALNEKAKKLQKCFPKEDFDMLCVYINEAPEDMTVEELVENYKH